MKLSGFRMFFLCMVFFMVGCTSTYDKLNRSDEYKQPISHNESLIVPKDLNRESIEDLYHVPKINDKRSVHSSTIPPGSKINK